MVYLPIIGAFLEATGMILEKKILKHKKVDYRNYTAYGFLAIVLVMLPVLYFFWRVDAAALTGFNLAIFASVVIVSVVANLLIFYSLKRETITEFEPVWLMQPLFTILLAFAFFSSERNWMIVALALVASLTLIASHVKKHHLVFDKYILAAVLGSLLFSLELVISRFILDYYSGFSFYFLRCFFIFVITFVLYKPGANFLKQGRVTLMIFVIAIIWVLYRVIIYYGYVTVGIVFTTMLFILSPVLMFLFAVIFLKEKPSLRHIISTIIILICVALAVVVDG